MTTEKCRGRTGAGDRCVQARFSGATGLPVWIGRGE